MPEYLRSLRNISGKKESQNKKPHELDDTPRMREGEDRNTEGMGFWLASSEALRAEVCYMCAYLSKECVFFILSLTHTPQFPTIPSHGSIP